MDSLKSKPKKELSQCKKAYLFSYNLWLFIVFLTVNMLSIAESVSKSQDEETIQWLATIVRLITYTQLLETVHPIIGLVPGGPMMPFAQVSGRMVVNLFIADPKICKDVGPFVLYLFIVWSTIELFRYSFYALRVFDIDIYPITWCRYSLFIPLYPLGGFCESRVVLATVKIYEKTGTYSFGLPNAANVSFHLPSALNFYTFFILGPGIYSLMKYMWAQRCKQLQPNDNPIKVHKS